MCTQGSLNASRSPQLLYVSQATFMITSKFSPPRQLPQQEIMGLMRMTSDRSAGEPFGHRHGVAIFKKSLGERQYS